MPISMPPISRRRFLAGSLAAGMGMLAGCSHLGRRAGDVDANRFALLSDTHLPADKTYVHKDGTAPWTNFQKASAEIRGLTTRPAAVLVSGDCARIHGLPEDYVTVVEGMKSFSDAGLPVHMALGNHDHRENFWKAMPADVARQTDLEEKHALIVSSPRANWFLLDSLVETNKTPGSLGERQLAWLAKALDERADKPAIVMLHHDPNPAKSGLEDTGALMDVLLPRKQVKAYVYGHTHIWQHSAQEGMHLVNLPPTAWLFDAKRPNGWVDVHLGKNGATLELRAFNAKHPEHGKKVELAWR